ncbi:hypothetical protein Patl1_12988 [Pistacia atlantica]|uniref:Uncharacterized protein n=1 Tax=Pistacia atlantica TaxID=434234 RepID=A0ACC1ASU5_9ROSI|nr:hypothetical protein Patl1_12988 [Pistacia atlantica]
MVNYMLLICADLENLTNLEPEGGCDNPNFSYFFKVKCGRCGEVSQKETCVTLNEVVPLSQGKGTTNLVQKCKFCGREGTVTMISGRGKPLTQEDSESGKYCPMMLFDCRGYEPVDYIFGGGWKVESVGFHFLSFHFVIQHEALYIFLSRIECGCKGYGAIQIAGTKYEAVDLSGGDFAEYDEKGECPVMISNLRSKFDVVK